MLPPGPCTRIVCIAYGVKYLVRVYPGVCLFGGRSRLVVHTSFVLIPVFCQSGVVACMPQLTTPVVQPSISCNES